MGKWIVIISFALMGACCLAMVVMVRVDTYRDWLGLSVTALTIAGAALCEYVAVRIWMGCP